MQTYSSGRIEARRGASLALMLEGAERCKLEPPTTKHATRSMQHQCCSKTSAIFVAMARRLEHLTQKQWRQNGKHFQGLPCGGRLAAAFAVSGTALAQTNFSAIYNGTSVLGGTCGSSFNIAGMEPTTARTYPVFVYMVGTSETYNDAAAMAAVNNMAARGYVAATIEYTNSQFGTCTVLSGKASCAPARRPIAAKVSWSPASARDRSLRSSRKTTTPAYRRRTAWDQTCSTPPTICARA